MNEIIEVEEIIEFKIIISEGRSFLTQDVKTIK